MTFIKHIAKAFLAAGYGGAVPAVIQGFPKLGAGMFLVGLVAHIIAYKPEVK